MKKEKGVREEVDGERDCVDRKSGDTQTQGERDKIDAVNTYFPQILRKVQNADTGQRSVFSFNPNII